MLWHDTESEAAKAMFAIPEDEQTQLEQFLLRSQHLSHGRQISLAHPGQGPEKAHSPHQSPDPHRLGTVRRPDSGRVCAGPFKSAIPGAEVTILPRCAHLPMYEDTEGFVKAVTGFLTSQP